MSSNTLDSIRVHAKGKRLEGVTRKTNRKLTVLVTNTVLDIARVNCGTYFEGKTALAFQGMRTERDDMFIYFNC